MISGQAKVGLVEYGLKLQGSTPSVIMGDNHTIAHMTSSLAMAIPFSCEPARSPLNSSTKPPAMSGDINDQVTNLLLEASTRAGLAHRPRNSIFWKCPSKEWPPFGFRSKKPWRPKKFPQIFWSRGSPPHQGILYQIPLGTGGLLPCSERCEHLAQVRKSNILAELQRKYVLMAIKPRHRVQ